MPKLTVATQLSIFLDNRPGVLARLCRELAAGDINIVALCVVDTVDSVVVRLLVDKVKDAEAILRPRVPVMHTRQVLFVESATQPGTLASIAERLAEVGINIEYAYCTSAGDTNGSPGGVVLRTNDLEGAINALS